MSSEIPLTDSIEQEIQEHGISSYLNNFLLRVPWHGYGTIYDDPTMSSGPDRKMIEVWGELDKPYKERGFQSDEKIKYSDQFLSQTPREFFRTIDEIIDKEGLGDIIGIASQERQELEQKYVATQKSGDIDEIDTLDKRVAINLERFNLCLKPVYFEMRKRGYSHDDLTR